MPISFACEYCAKRLTAMDAAAGKVLKCPSCKFMVPVPKHDTQDPEKTAKIGKQKPAPPQENNLIKNALIGVVILLLVAFIFFVIFESSRGPGSGADTLGDSVILAIVISLYAAFFTLPLYIGYKIGKHRVMGPWGGLAFGVVLSWLGVLIVLCFPKLGATKICPECGEDVKAAARVCRFCKARLAE